MVAEASIAIRKILSVDRNPPIAQVLGAGILPRLRELLCDYSRPSVQLEACWALTNIASGSAEQTQAVVESGVVPIFVQLLNSSDLCLQEQALWAVANIAGDRAKYRDGCISAGTVEALSKIVDASLRTKSVQLTRLATWGIANLCRGKPAPPLSQLSPALPSLNRALTLSNDTEVLADAAWGLSYLTENSSPESILAIVHAVDVARVVALLAHPSSSVHTPILRAVGNLVSGESEITRRIVSAGALMQLKSLILSNKKSVRKEALWAISNVCADSQAHIQAVIDSGAMDRICDLLRSGTGDTDVRKEAIWSLCNSCTVGSKQQISLLVFDSRFRMIELLSSFLDGSRDTKSIRTVLDAMYAVLAAGGSEGYEANQFAAVLEECGGLTTIEDLQQDEADEVYSAAVRILENFFNCDQDVDGNAVNNENRVLFDFSSSNKAAVDKTAGSSRSFARSG